jgi:hypothetical protein
LECGDSSPLLFLCLVRKTKAALNVTRHKVLP